MHGVKNEKAFSAADGFVISLFRMTSRIFLKKPLYETIKDGMYFASLVEAHYWPKRIGGAWKINRETSHRIHK